MAVAVPSDRHISAARQRLTHLAKIAGKTDATERAILKAARERMQVVQGDLAKLRPRALLDGAAADQVLALTEERGRLALVIAQSKSKATIA